MPKHTAAEQEKNRRNKSARAIAAADASEQSKVKPAAKPAPVVKAEKAGVGRDDSNTNADRLGRQMRAAIDRARASGNLKKVDDLKARLKQLEATRSQ